MQEICRIFVEVGGYRFAWVGFAKQNAEKELDPVAKWGFEEGFIETMQATWGDSERGRGPAGTTIRTGKTTVFQDFATNPDYRPWRSRAIKCGYASGISLPLTVKGKAFGALVIFSEESHAFDAAEVALMEELANDLSYGIKTIRIEAERERISTAQTLLANVIEQASDAVLTFDHDGRIDYINPAFGRLFAVDVEATLGKQIDQLESCQSNELFYFELQKTIYTDQPQTGQFVNRRPDGSSYEFVARISPVFSGDRVIKYVAMLRDVTHETALEQQLRQSQKMEAIATLSGGIAHDFNNILAVIITNTEMNLEDIDPGSPLRQHLELVLKAGFRGSNLVKQILTLSQQHEQERQPVQVEAIIQECFHLLRASLPTTIELKQLIAGDLGLITADPTQIHQVVMNLCTNAAQALHETGGCLEAALAEVYLDAAAVADYPGLDPGYYQQLSVSDNGAGMAREVVERIFDPFFTTKNPGKGTGLGLSVVHGIVKSHQGAITVISQPGEGTTFRLLFPRFNGSVEDRPLASGIDLPCGNERLLFVDDETDYVLAQQRLLQRLGYRVTAVTDSREALRQILETPYAFDLLITDQTMPYMTGDMLAREVMKLRPELPIILCTGSSPETDHAVTPEKVRALGIGEVLYKPVNRRELDQAIRRQLNAPPAEIQEGGNVEYSYH